MWEASINQAKNITGEPDSDDDENEELTSPERRMARAVLTRWWYVTCAVIHLLEHWTGWLNFANACCNATRTTSKINKIASSIWSLMQEPELRCDLEFIGAFAKEYFHDHFRWLQGHDLYAKDYGF